MPQCRVGLLATTAQQTCPRRDLGSIIALTLASIEPPHAKGLRDRNSPTCTLSQNGYGDGVGMM